MIAAVVVVAALPFFASIAAQVSGLHQPHSIETHKKRIKRRNSRHILQIPIPDGKCLIETTKNHCMKQSMMMNRATIKLLANFSFIIIIILFIACQFFFLFFNLNAIEMHFEFGFPC